MYGLVLLQDILSSPYDKQPHWVGPLKQDQAHMEIKLIWVGPLGHHQARMASNPVWVGPLRQHQARMASNPVWVGPLGHIIKLVWQATLYGLVLSDNNVYTPIRNKVCTSGLKTLPYASLSGPYLVAQVGGM